MNIAALRIKHENDPRRFQQAFYVGFLTIQSGDGVDHIRLAELAQILLSLPLKPEQIDGLGRLLPKMSDDLMTHKTGKHRFNEFITNILLMIYGVKGKTPHFIEAVLFLCAMLTGDASTHDNVIDEERVQLMAQKIPLIADELKNEKNTDGRINGMIVLQDHDTLKELVKYIHTVKSRKHQKIPAQCSLNCIGIDIAALPNENPTEFVRAFYEAFLTKQLGCTTKKEGLPELLEVLTHLSFEPPQSLEDLLEPIVNALSEAGEILIKYNALSPQNRKILTRTTFKTKRLADRLAGFLHFKGIIRRKKIPLKLLTESASSNLYATLQMLVVGKTQKQKTDKQTQSSSSSMIKRSDSEKFAELYF